MGFTENLKKWTEGKIKATTDFELAERKAEAEKITQKREHELEMAAKTKIARTKLLNLGVADLMDDIAKSVQAVIGNPPYKEEPDRYISGTLINGFRDEHSANFSGEIELYKHVYAGTTSRFHSGGTDGGGWSEYLHLWGLNATYLVGGDSLKFSSYLRDVKLDVKELINVSKHIEQWTREDIEKTLLSTLPK